MTDRPVDLIDRAMSDYVADALVVALPKAVERLAELGGPRAYTVAQVADRLGVSAPTVRRLIAAGHLRTVPHIPASVGARVAATTLADFVEARAKAAE